MAESGPWEDFQAADTSGPWEDFAQPQQPPEGPANALQASPARPDEASATTPQPGWLQALLSGRSGTQTDVAEQKQAVEFMQSPEAQKGLVPTAAIEKALGAMGEIGGDTTQDPVSQSINKAIAERVSGITSPAMIGQAPMFFNPGVRAMYAAEMVDPAAQQIADAMRAMQEGNYPEAAYKGTGGAADTLMAALLGKSLAPPRGLPAEAAPETAAEKPTIQAETSQAEPPPIRHVSPETGFEFDIDPKTGEVIQPKAQEPAIPKTDELGQVSESAAREFEATRGEQQARSKFAPPEQPPDLGQPGGAAGGEGAGAPAGTSNRLNAQIYGEQGVPSGEGVDTGKLLDNARAAIRSGNTDPYSVLSKTRQSGIANAQEYAVLAAEHERLVNEAVAKEKAGDPTAPEAARAANDFANAIQPHKTAASDVFRLMQGDLNYDLSTTFGMDQYMKAEIGRGLKPAEKPVFEQRARGIRNAESEVPQAVARADARVRAHYAKVRDIPMQEAAARVREWLKDCQV